ncbi:hypothetical protein FS749_011824 [Ceratobasidium sp. UAMH 11750]|nr:hypothetical protein FS749_011824 [Ceratobasidium sp. UAMH 11750]
MAPLAPSKLKVSSKSKQPLVKSKINRSSVSKTIPKSAAPAPATKRRVPAVAVTPSESEEEAHIKGFSSDEDSSDEDEDDDEAPEIPGIDISKLPTIAKDDATVKRKLERAKRDPTQDRGVLYLARIPHGFYEDEMKAYFSQFGNVTRLRISRNKKTGKSKHYGFIEFDSASVAQIVSETMDNYLLMGHILQCKVVPKDQIHPELWVGSNRKWRTVPRDRVHRVKHNMTRTEDQQKRVERKLLKKQADRQAKITAAGIKYDIAATGYRKPTSN